MFAWYVLHNKLKHRYVCLIIIFNKKSCQHTLVTDEDDGSIQIFKYKYKYNNVRLFNK